VDGVLKSGKRMGETIQGVGTIRQGGDQRIVAEVNVHGATSTQLVMGSTMADVFHRNSTQSDYCTEVLRSKDLLSHPERTGAESYIYEACLHAYAFDRNWSDDFGTERGTFTDPKKAAAHMRPKVQVGVDTAVRIGTGIKKTTESTTDAFLVLKRLVDEYDAVNKVHRIYNTTKDIVVEMRNLMEITGAHVSATVEGEPQIRNTLFMLTGWTRFAPDSHHRHKMMVSRLSGPTSKLLPMGRQASRGSQLALRPREDIPVFEGVDDPWWLRIVDTLASDDEGRTRMGVIPVVVRDLWTAYCERHQELLETDPGAMELVGKSYMRKVVDHRFSERIHAAVSKISDHSSRTRHLHTPNGALIRSMGRGEGGFAPSSVHVAGIHDRIMDTLHRRTLVPQLHKLAHSVYGIGYVWYRVGRYVQSYLPRKVAHMTGLSLNPPPIDYAITFNGIGTIPELGDAIPLDFLNQIVQILLDCWDDDLNRDCWESGTCTKWCFPKINPAFVFVELTINPRQEFEAIAGAPLPWICPAFSDINPNLYTFSGDFGIFTPLVWRIRSAFRHVILILRTLLIDSLALDTTFGPILEQLGIDINWGIADNGTIDDEIRCLAQNFGGTFATFWFFFPVVVGSLVCIPCTWAFINDQCVQGIDTCCCFRDCLFLFLCCAPLQRNGVFKPPVFTRFGARTDRAAHREKRSAALKAMAVELKNGPADRERASKTQSYRPGSKTMRNRSQPGSTMNTFDSYDASADADTKSMWNPRTVISALRLWEDTGVDDTASERSDDDELMSDAESVDSADSFGDRPIRGSLPVLHPPRRSLIRPPETRRPRDPTKHH
jgi:hypothetical protein